MNAALILKFWINRIYWILFISSIFFATAPGYSHKAENNTQLTAVVTGANRGIGLEFCKQLSERGYCVIAVCRNSSDSLESIPCTVIDGIDVTNDSDIKKMAEKIHNQNIDLLINNAAIGLDDSFWDASRASLVSQFDTNAVSPFLLTMALQNNLSDNAKVIMITSRMGSLSTVQSKNGIFGESYVGYSVSKTALNMFVSKMAIAFKQKKDKSNISVLALHPGYVKTAMTDYLGDINTETSVKGMLEQIDKLSPATSGTFVQYDGTPIEW